MAENFGTGVSYVNEAAGYNYDTVIFQKGKPPMDSEVNLVQQLQRIINQRQLSHLASGWLTLRPFYTSPLLKNSFYSQNPSGALPEYALVNGFVVKVANTNTQTPNANLIELGTPPVTGNVVNGIFLEVWRALLDPNTNTNKPDPIAIVDSILDIEVLDQNHGFAVGENGLILNTTNGGQTWNSQLIDTKYNLNGVSFVNTSIGWVVGDNGVIGRTSSGGSSWTLLTSGITENLKAVSSVDQLTAWAVGTSGTIMKTVNGITFTPQSSGVTVNLNGVYFYNSLVGWAAGDNGVVLKTTNGGMTWLQMTTGSTKNLNSVFFYDLNFGFAVGNGGTLLRTSDGGSTWVSQSGNVNTGSGYTTVTQDLLDVTMAPSLDEYENGEEVSGQLDGTNKNFTVLHMPITKGDGNGTTTNDPAYVTVTVNGTEVSIASMNGSTGQIILSEAPRLCDTVKVYYWHRVATGIFRGKVWVTGRNGTVMRTDNLGADWFVQNPNTSYDVNAVAFADQAVGWLGGQFQVMRYTDNGGDTWSVQQSKAVARIVQRVFSEGNINTKIYLNDDSIHPDTAIETTKRVQVQYRIRVVSNVDPANYPEAGLGMASVVGLGPNSTGSFAFENQGSVNGDYGLWMAKCPNTVDGYCWAIPMCFVNRRNSSSYDPATNANGETKPGTANIRPDLLTSTDVVDSDILDVRRQVVVPDADSILEKAFDYLSDNKLRTHLVRDTIAGDHYGTELLQLDRIGAGTGGQKLSGSLSDAVNGLINASTSKSWFSNSYPANVHNPAPILIESDAIFSSDPADYSITYVGGAMDGKTVPGTFSGFGTSNVTFTFSPNALKSPSVTKYSVTIGQYVQGSSPLTHIPSVPKLVKNTQGSSSAFYYFGVNKNMASVVEQWDSGITGKPNYVVAYPCTVASDKAQRDRASSLEMHLFVKLTSSIIDPVNNRKISIDRSIYPVSGDVPYIIYTVSKINNLDAGFSYKMTNVTTVSDKIEINTAAGFEFLAGTTVELVAYILSDVGLYAKRNGATVNFSSNNRGIEKFCRSELIQASIKSPTRAEASVTGTILGVPTIETVTGLAQTVCWIDQGAGYTMVPATITGIGESTIIINYIQNPDGTSYTVPVPNVIAVQIQVMYQQAELQFFDDSQDGLYIGYNYVPYQCVGDLPSFMNVEMVTKPKVLNISNLGSGGGTAGEPYSNPIEHIPVNDPSITDEKSFFNLEPLVFNNFSVDTGFIQMPIYVPASLSSDVTLSGVSRDAIGRSYYSSCSENIKFITEGMAKAIQRKIYVAMIAKVKSVSDGKFLPGEYIMVIMSRNTSTDKQNYAGFQAGTNTAIAVYRLPNKPISKV